MPTQDGADTVLPSDQRPRKHSCNGSLLNVIVLNMSVVEVGREGSQISVQVTGSGPLVLCVPGMGETRASFRHLFQDLSSAGRTAAGMDLRGHGNSSTQFDNYDDVAAAGDILAVIDALGGRPAVVVGNSMGAAAAVLAAAQCPEAVSHLVLIGPFVRDHSSAATRLLMRLALSRPWGHGIWSKYYKSLFGAKTPTDHQQHVSETLARLRALDRWRAFQKTARTSHAPAEAALVARALRGRYQMVPGAGHYPMGEQSEVVLAAITSFLAETTETTETEESDR